jgi:hypothetical protein
MRATERELMFKLFDKNEPDDLDALITDVTDNMQSMSVDDERYLDLLDKLERLKKLKQAEKPERISRDTIVNIVGNLTGILLIVAYEQKHVMTTKAFGWIKPKA